MGSLLSTLGLDDLLGSSSSNGSLGYNNELQCCPGVVDILTLLSVLAAIIGVTVFLRQAIIDSVSVGRRKRDLQNHHDGSTATTLRIKTGKIPALRTEHFGRLDTSIL